MQERARQISYISGKCSVQSLVIKFYGSRAITKNFPALLFIAKPLLKTNLSFHAQH